jgi:hypothetical protein
MTITPALGLRPNGDAYKLGLAYSSGSTAWSLLDDEPFDDASYVRSPAGTTYPANKLHVRLTDLPALTASQRIKAVRQRARVRMHAADPNRRGSVTMRPWDPQSGLGVKGAKVVEEPAGVVDQFSLANATTFAPVTGMWRTRPPASDGKEWTRAIVNRLVLHVAWHYSAGAAHENLRLSELYLDVDVREQPVVTGVAVSGWDTTTRPTVTWDFVPNPDADPQQAYQVKVFYAAQADAPGFNPATAAAQWDSGTVPAGPAFSAQVGADLVNGQSYKAYVRAAADFNGAYWFSAWASSSGFTIALEPPPIPTLVVEADQRPCVLRNKLTVSGLLNLLSANQASLETDTAGWAAGQDTAIVRTLDQAAHGIASLQLTRTAAGNGMMWANTTAGVLGARVQAGQTYHAVAFFRPASTPRSVRTRIAFYDQNGTYIAGPGSPDILGYPTMEQAGAWVEAQGFADIAPQGAVTAAVEVRIGEDFVPANQPVQNEVHDVDKIALVPAAAAGPAPLGAWTAGGFVGNTSLVVEYSWATTCPGNLAHPQLAGGGDGFNRNSDGFFASGAWPTAASYDKTLARTGEGSIFWDLHDPAGRLYIGWGEGPTFDPAPAYPLATVPGRSYRFACWARCKPDTPQFLATPWLQAIDKDGNPVGPAQQGAQVLIGQDWAELVVDTYTAPVVTGAPVVWTKAFLSNDAAAPVAHLNVDDVAWHLLPPRGCGPRAVNPCGQPTVWKPLRGADVGDLLAPNVNAQLVIYDNEVPPGATVTYRARAHSTLNDGLSSDFTPYAQTMLEPPGRGIYLLGDPIGWASTNRMCVRVTAVRESQHEEATTYYPLRPTQWQQFAQRPVTVSDYMGGHDGELEIVVASEDEWWLLRQLLHTNRPLWLVWPDFGGRWIRITDRSWDRQGYDRAGEGWRRRVRVPFLEAARPT